jgi:hypothetical protein
MPRRKLIAFPTVWSAPTESASGGDTSGSGGVRRTLRPVAPRTPKEARAQIGVSVVDCFRSRYEEAMTDPEERRAVPRTTLAGNLPVRVRDGREVHLLDLSRDGARIEHLDLFRPGAACPLELPPPFGSLTLPAQVVWCSVIGRKRRPGGESPLWPGFSALNTSPPLDSHIGSAQFLLPQRPWLGSPMGTWRTALPSRVPPDARGDIRAYRQTGSRAIPVAHSP